MNRNDFPLIEMSFLLTGQKDYLQEITDTLSIKPSRIRRKEEFRLEEFSCFMWELTTGKQHSKCVKVQSEELLKQLQGKENLILGLKKDYELNVDLLVTIHAENCDGPEITLSKEIITFAAQIGSEIGFDMYFY